MFDCNGNKIEIGDKVKILKSDYPNHIGKIVSVMTPDAENKIRVSFSDQWQGYFKYNEIEKQFDLRNAEYFRKLQGTKSIDELVEGDVKFILDTIENKIKNGYKEESIKIDFNITYNECDKLVKKLMHEYEFNVHAVNIHQGYEITICWSKQ
jgi:hypothetical protein